MRMTGVSTPFTSYTIPPSAPDPVADAWRELNRIGILYEDASDDLKDAEQALVAAQAADVQAIVDATNAGEEAKDPQANERKAQAEIERLTTVKRGLREAADQAGGGSWLRPSRGRHGTLPALVRRTAQPSQP